MYMKNKKKGQPDLIHAPILSALVRLATPIMASAFLGTAYNITDMFWIGILGAKAVAGVGVGGMYLWLSQGLVSLARMGGQVNVAQAIGRRDYKRAEEYARGALQLSVLFSLLYGALCLGFTGPLIAFLGLQDAEASAYAWIYLRISGGLIIFNYLSQTLSGLFTAQGDSASPFRANLLGLLVNMLLDPVLVMGLFGFPRLGVVGAAVATVLAQFLVFLSMSLQLLLRRDSDNVLRQLRLFRLPPMQELKSIVRIGLPTALQGTIYCGISMILTRMVAVFGSGAVATQRVGGQIESLSWNVADGFATALNAFIGQNFGAGRMDRVREGYRTAFRYMGAWGVFISLLFIIFPGPIASLFFREQEVLVIAIAYLVIIGFSESFMCIELMTIGALSGLGKTSLCSVISISLTSARIPLAYVLSETALGLNGIWWALTLTSVIKGIVFWLTFRRVSGRLQPLSAPEAG